MAMVGRVLGSAVGRTRVATRLVGRGGLATVAVVLVYAAVAAQPAQAKVSCGDVITEDTKLNKDLNCSGDGLEIDADDVTLDLNGHFIKGDGSGTGVLVDGQSGVKIKNGTVKEFAIGIFLTGTDDSTVKQVDARDHGAYGIFLTGSDNNTIERNKTKGNGNVGINVQSDSDDNTIDANTASRIDGDGIVVVNGIRNRVKQNTVNGNGSVGIGLFDTGDNIVEENTTKGNGDDGISVNSSSTDTVLRANHTDDNGDDGIDVNASDNGTSIGDNRANDNDDLGIEAEPGVDDAGGNRAHGNGDPQQCTGVSCS
jgi:parallel beta-helix repeat protein